MTTGSTTDIATSVGNVSSVAGPLAGFFALDNHSQTHDAAHRRISRLIWHTAPPPFAGLVYYVAVTVVGRFLAAVLSFPVGVN